MGRLRQIYNPISEKRLTKNRRAAIITLASVKRAPRNIQAQGRGLFAPKHIQEETTMSTTLAKPAQVERSWYVLDAAGVPLGRVATQAAVLLRGKHKVIFTPHVDCGDHVIIINCDKAVLTGNKLDQKFYRRHSGWVGSLKETSYRKLMSERSDFAMMQAVRGMLPKNTLGANMLKRLRVYKGPEHKNAAQKPQEFKL